jgi:hypothetical protein
MEERVNPERFTTIDWFGMAVDGTNDSVAARILGPGEPATGLSPREPDSRKARAITTSPTIVRTRSLGLTVTFHPHAPEAKT